MNSHGINGELLERGSPLAHPGVILQIPALVSLCASSSSEPS